MNDSTTGLGTDKPHETNATHAAVSLVVDHKDHDWDSLLAAAKAQEKRQHSFYTAKEFGPVMHTLICEKHWTLADTCRWIIAQGFKYSAVNLRLGYELWLEKNPEKRADLPGYFRPLAKRQKARAPEAP